MTNMATLHNVLKRYDDIIKPENDDTFYRGLVLKNKMKVLLISDPRTEKSAAAMNVNIGYMCDPDDLPGLARLCEHMLFMENKKYSRQNNYKQYLSENGGLCNATTYSDHTTYYFNVNSSKLRDALDRFAQSFRTPLFTEYLINLKVNYIHSEYSKYLASDTHRYQQLERSSANYRHPFSKFNAGNKKTLNVLPKQMGINVRQKLIEFYEKYYSANIMSLCVFSAETLDNLEKMVVKLFGYMQNKEINIPTCSEPPFDDKHFRMKWYMVSIEDKRNLCVSFPTPDLQERYQSKPTYYVSHLLNNSGRGSLLSALKRRNWCNSISCEKRTQFRGFCCFFFEVDLTEEGLHHVDDIITLMFQYIHMLKEQGPIEWFYNEYQNLAKIKFRFIENELAHSYVSSIATNLRDYPMQETLCEDILVPQWKPESIDSINAIIRCLTPQNIRVYVIAKECENVANETERWYGTKYKKEKISPEIIDMWKNAGHNSEFHLPEKNQFIPSKFDLKPRNDKVDKFPAIILDTMFIRLWFKQDDEYLVPKAKMFFLFASPCITMDPVSFNLAYIYVELLQDLRNECVYPAELAVLHWLFECTVEGIILSIYGYDHKQHLLLEQIVERMSNLEIDPTRFAIVKENYIRYCKCFVAKDLCEQVYDYLGQLFYESVFTGSEILHATKYLTVDRLQAFIPQLFSKVHVECLIHGNMIKKEALDIAEMVESKLKTAMPHITPLWQHQLVLRREVKLDIGCHFLFQMKNVCHAKSCTAVFYQIGMQSVELSLLLELLTKIIEKQCFDTLRIKEKLGYTVLTCTYKLNMMEGLLIVVEGYKKPRFVEKRIDSFIDSMLNYISTMSIDKFRQYIYIIRDLRCIKLKDLFDKTDMFWKEIRKQMYNFDRAHNELAYLRTVTPAQLIKFFKVFQGYRAVDFIFNLTSNPTSSENIHGPARRKLSLHITPTIRHNDESEEEEFDEMMATGQKIEINDISSFKCSQSLYPALEPHIKQFSKKGLCSSKSLIIQQ